MIGKIGRLSILAFLIAAPAVDIAVARTVYDGSWSLSIVTERGTCDHSYNFPVQIANGIVTFPGLVKAGGRVSSGGAVRVTVSAGEKHASGSGRLSQASGRGRWAGRSGRDRCSGSWSAQRN
jgi:hypothetical protein